MQWVLWMIAVAVLGLAAVAASGRLGELPGTVTDSPRPHVPTGVLSGDDLRALRFAVVPRGYSMDQVDELLDRLARQLDQQPADAPHLGTPAPLAAAADAPSAGAHAPGEGAADPGSIGVADEPTSAGYDTQPDDAAGALPDEAAGDPTLGAGDTRLYDAVHPAPAEVVGEPTVDVRDTQFDDAADPSSDEPAADDPVTEPDETVGPSQPGADQDHTEPTEPNAVLPAARRDHDAPAGGSRPTVGRASPQSGIMDEVSPQTERG